MGITVIIALYNLRRKKLGTYAEQACTSKNGVLRLIEDALELGNCGLEITVLLQIVCQVIHLFPSLSVAILIFLSALGDGHEITVAPAEIYGIFLGIFSRFAIFIVTIAFGRGYVHFHEMTVAIV